MTCLLDSIVIIAILAGTPSVMRHLRERSLNNIAVSAIAMHELYFGIAKSARPERNLASLASLLLPVLPFDVDDARHAGEIRAHLTAAGTPIGPYDTLIAAQARTRDLTLITRNIREFRRVPGLRLENWEA